MAKKRRSMHALSRGDGVANLFCLHNYLVDRVAFLKRIFILEKSIGSKTSDLVSHSTSFLVFGYITQYDVGWIMA